MNPLLTKMLVTAAAIGVYLLASVRPDLKEVLYPLAGAMAGGMWLQTPGDVAINKVDGPVQMKALVSHSEPTTVVVAKDVTPPLP